MNIVTTGTGFFKPGIKGRIVGTPEPRTVFLGPVGQEKRHVIAEYSVLLERDTAPRTGCQLGRDFIFET